MEIAKKKRSLLRNQRGATGTEYGVIVVTVCVVIFAGGQVLGKAVEKAMTDVAGMLKIEKK